MVCGENVVFSGDGAAGRSVNDGFTEIYGGWNLSNNNKYHTNFALPKETQPELLLDRRISGMYAES